MKLLAIDANSILNRAFYGVKLLSTSKGDYTNALVGFLNILQKLLSELSPDQVVFAFDLPGGTFRNKMYDAYKANRKGMPPELAAQLPLIKEILTLMGYKILELQGFEGDDILGTLAAACAEDDSCFIATGDRDALQLVSDRVTVVLASTKAGGAQYIPMTPAAIQEQYGLEPSALLEVKALMGDSSDNIPGVAGIGEKTAIPLIAKYSNLERIYEDVSALEATPGVKTKLEKGRESAFLSRDLARIRTDVPITTDPQSLMRTPTDEGGLYDLLARLEMFTHIKRLGLAPTGGQTSGDAPTPNRPTFTTGQGGHELPNYGDAPIYIAAECAGESLTALAVAQGQDVTVWQNPSPEILKELAELENPKYTDDCKAFYRAMWPNAPKNVVFDCRLAGYILSPDANDYSVERLCGQYGILTPAARDEQTDENTLLLAAAAMPYLCRHLEELTEQYGQTDLLRQIEIPLAEVLSDMERLGFSLDKEKLLEFGSELEQHIELLQGEILQLAGGEFNINSPKQLGEVLFERLNLPVRKKTKSGYSTDAEVLESLQSYHPIVEKVLDYRKYTKLKSTYVEGLSKQVEQDGRIRSVFNQTETRTGRISSAEPNLQNIPIRTELGARMRGFFSACRDWVLVDADYSQIELRVLAAISEDEQMTEAFLCGEDIHTNTAAQVFDLPPMFITPLMRRRAKAVNFGIVYGIGAFSLSKDIGVSMAEADGYIKNYLKTYSGVKKYMEETIAQGKELGYVSTIFGRRRYLPELKSSNRNLRAFGERVAMNAPVQGTAADIIKIAMIRVYNRLREEGLEAKLILQVHDELLVEAPKHESDRVAELLKHEMEEAVKLSVPMEVEVGIGQTWQEAH